MSLSQLRHLCEDLRCRHQLSCTELQRLVKERAATKEVRRTYKECIYIRAQWNIFHNVVRRIENDLRSPNGFSTIELIVVLSFECNLLLC